MALPYIESINSLILPALYLGSGYLSILLGYAISRDTDIFFKEIQGTDKIMLTFLIGAFSVLISTSIPGIPATVNKSNIIELIAPLFGVTLVNALVIVWIRENRRNQ